MAHNLRFKITPLEDGTIASSEAEAVYMSYYDTSKIIGTFYEEESDGTYQIIVFDDSTSCDQFQADMDALNDNSTDSVRSNLSRYNS